MAGTGRLYASRRCLIVLAMCWLMRSTAMSSRVVNSLNESSICCCVVSINERR